jgi:hypothetical protein
MLTNCDQMEPESDHWLTNRDAPLFSLEREDGLIRVWKVNSDLDKLEVADTLSTKTRMKAKSKEKELNFIESGGFQWNGWLLLFDLAVGTK